VKLECVWKLNSKIYSFKTINAQIPLEVTSKGPHTNHCRPSDLEVITSDIIGNTIFKIWKLS
jgi:hypothetical protein